MNIISVGKETTHKDLNIINIKEDELDKYENIDYLIIHGGDGSIRRTVSKLHKAKKYPNIIINPIGSFNVVAKMHRVPKLQKVLDALAKDEIPKTKKHKFFTLNGEVFLFSAGNMGDLQHIFVSETLRFGILKKGMTKYILAVIFLLPIHIIMTPFMLLSKRRFFIFTPMPFISKLGSFYNDIKELTIDLDNHYNIIELDGDIVPIEESILYIREAGFISVVSS